MLNEHQNAPFGRKIPIISWGSMPPDLPSCMCLRHLLASHSPPPSQNPGYGPESCSPKVVEPRHIPGREQDEL